jgi:hypothetical protein
MDRPLPPGTERAGRAQTMYTCEDACRDGGIGLRGCLKSICPKGHAGSNPAPGTPTVRCSRFLLVIGSPRLSVPSATIRACTRERRSTSLYCSPVWMSWTGRMLRSAASLFAPSVTGDMAAAVIQRRSERDGDLHARDVTEGHWTSRRTPTYSACTWATVTLPMGAEVATR